MEVSCRIGGDNIGDLKSAILDNIMAEYNYVNEMKKNTGNDVAPKTLFFPELNLSQYIGKMHHPVLRRVNSLDVVAVMDLMSVDHECDLLEIYLYRSFHFSNKD